MGQHRSYGPRDLATLIFNLGGHYGDTGLRAPMLHLCIKFKVRRPSHSEDMTTFGLSISRPVDLDLSPWNCSLLYCHLGGQPFYQFWCLCAFSLSTYGPTPVRWTTWPCDLDPWPWRSRRLSLIEILILCLCTMLELSRSEDIAHLLCEH